MNGRAAAVRLPAMSAHRLMWLAGLLIGVVGLMMLYAPDPVHSRLCAPCPFHLLTGLYCPGCGTTRALHQLLHGHIRAALGLNPLMVALLPWVVYAGISQAAGR